MGNLLRRAIYFFCVFCAVIFMNLFGVFKGSEALAKDLNVPVYIIKNHGSSEIFIDKTDFENYSIRNIVIADLKSNKDIIASLVDGKFFIYEDLENNNEYVLKISLTDITSGKNIEYNSNFKYLETNFSVKNISLNSCDVVVNYSGKDLILINEFSIHGKDALNTEDFYEFSVKKSKEDLNTYKSTFTFKDVSISPNTNYKMSFIVSMNNSINLVSNKEFSTSGFEITKLKSQMISDKKIKLDWSLSDKNFKFVGKDAIKIYVKQFGELNYQSIPHTKISKSGVYSTVLDLEDISSEYDIKLVYCLGSKEFHKTIKQTNNFYELNTKVSLPNHRGVRILFGFDNKFKFKNGEVLNIYLVDESNGYVNREKIFSQNIDSIPFSPYYKVEFNNLKVDHEYKIIYEVVYNDGTVLKIKEDVFSTPQFGIKNLNISGVVDKQNNLKVSLNWQFSKSKFKFIEGDSLSVFIKEKDESEYSSNPYFYADKNLDGLSSLDIDVKGNVKGAYDVKIVYNLGGKKYTEFKSLYINSEVITKKIFSSKTPLSIVSDEEQVYGEVVKVTVKDVGVNQVVLEALYPENFQFEDGDSIQIYAREKHSRASDKPVKEYIHSSSGDSELDLKSMTSFVVDYLIPNKEYEFTVSFKTKNEFKKDEQVGNGGTTEGENGETQEPEAGGSEGSGNGENVEGGSGTPEGGETEGDGTTGGEGAGESGSGDDSLGNVENGTIGDGEPGVGSDEGDTGQDSGASDPSVEGEVTTFSTFQKSNTDENGMYLKEIKIASVTMKDFVIETFEPRIIRTNSAVFDWTLSQDGIEFNDNDKLEIFVKRKIVGGYPVGSLFSKQGKDIKGIVSGETIVQHMNMEYTAKIVYLISGVKFEKTVDFTTLAGTTSCSTKEPTEHSVKLLINYPEEYKFLEGDSIQIYIKEKHEKNFGKIPIVTAFHDEEQKLEDITTVNLIYLKPQMPYEVLIKFINKANDIPDCTTSFSTAPVIFQNCRFEYLKNGKLRVKTDFKNGEDVFEYVKFSLYVDVFQKSPDNPNYSSGVLASMSADEILDFEFEVPDRFSDRDFLISFNPHGYFNESLFIDFEIPYRVIRAVVDESQITQDNVKKKSYTLKWTYYEPIEFSSGDKINIYIKEILDTGVIQGKEEYITDPIMEGYSKIKTIDSNLETVTSFNIDYFINANKNYEIVIELESEKFKAGPAKISLSVGDIELEENDSESSEDEEDIVFDVPITVEDFAGLGDALVFNVPEIVSSNTSIDADNIRCDIEGISFELRDNDIRVKGLVPGKEYAKIEVKVQVEEGKEIVFNLENVKLMAEDDSQAFLYDVYKKSFLRDPDELGYKYWIDRLKTKDISARNFLINLLFAEKEFSEMNYDTKEFITVLYSIIVNREPDSEGLDFWIKFYSDDALVNTNGDHFEAKKYIVDRMINEKEFEKLIVAMGLEY